MTDKTIEYEAFVSVADEVKAIIDRESDAGNADGMLCIMATMTGDQARRMDDPEHYRERSIAWLNKAFNGEFD
jgi:hypothetical protein